MKIKLWPAIVITAFVFTISIAVILTVKWPFTEARLVRNLQARTGRDVQIGAFQKIYFPPGFIANDIRFLRPEHPDQQPPISIDKLVVKASWRRRIEHLMLETQETEARMDGTFHLLSKELDMKGTLKTDGKLCDTQNGVKAFAVMLITPFLKKRNTTLVPFEIKGTAGHLSTRLDWDAIRKL